MQIGASVDGNEPPSLLRALTEAAEAAGAANLWLATHLFNREPIACAAAVLGQTRRLGVVSGVGGVSLVLGRVQGHGRRCYRRPAHPFAPCHRETASTVWLG